MATTPEFIRRQYEFAAHIRDPGHAPAPADIEDRRMGIYRELFYNNVESFLSGTFPVLRNIHDDDSWHALVREFFARHRSRTPLFLEIPREFLNWLEHGHNARPEELPFLYELDDMLSGQSYLYGQKRSVADIGIAPFVRQFAHVDRQWFYAQGWENLKPWLKAFLASDAFKRIMKKYPKWVDGDKVTLFPPKVS